MNGTTSTQDGNQRKHVREHVLANAAIQLMNGESPELTPSAQAHLERCDVLRGAARRTPRHHVDRTRRCHGRRRRGVSGIAAARAARLDPGAPRTGPRRLARAPLPDVPGHPLVDGAARPSRHALARRRGRGRPAGRPGRGSGRVHRASAPLPRHQPRPRRRPPGAVSTLAQAPALPRRRTSNGCRRPPRKRSSPTWSWC